VVLPSLAHLSGDLATLTRMRAQLDHTGATTTIMPRTQPHRRPSKPDRQPPGLTQTTSPRAGPADSP
jgi:hypothetical protein